MNWRDLMTWGSTPVSGGVAANPELMQMNNYALNTGNAAPVAGAPQGSTWYGDLFGSMFDTTDANGIKTQGWGGLALQGLQGLGNSYMGMKQFGLAEDALKEQKRQFNVNFEAQRKMTNSQLADRQRARVASNPGAYQSEAEYMKQWGV